MTDPTESPEATEADVMGERPDHGRQPDALIDALTGSGMGSDTRAGSLEGGAASGSDDDPDQDTIDGDLTREGRYGADEDRVADAATSPD